jgi:hemerythrin superfamily protein
MDALDFLKKQHDLVERLFTKIEGADEAERIVLLEDLADVMAIHAEIEEQIFYPAVKAEQTMDLLEHSVEEHLEVKRLLTKLVAMEPEEDLEPDLREVMSSIRDHVQEEENELFPKVRELFDEEQLSKMGDALAKMTRQLLQDEIPSERAEDELDAPAPL